MLFGGRISWFLVPKNDANRTYMEIKKIMIGITYYRRMKNKTRAKRKLEILFVNQYA